MRARVLLAGVVAAVLVPQPSVAVPAQESVGSRAASVEVAHLMFMPGKAEVALGASVTWTFPEATAHTTTSDQGFWDSGTKSGGATYVRAFTSAGKFAYHCSIHPGMRGSVAVGITVNVPGEGKHIVRWSTAKATGNITFDVQVKIGSGAWTDFRVDTVRPKATFKAATMPDTYKVRARTSKGDRNSGWSRTVRLTFP